MSKSIGLDLSKFKHVKSDDKSTTLQHYEGHTIQLAHRALSKQHQEALKAMANRANERAEAEGDGKPSTTEKLAKGGYVKENDPMKGGGAEGSGSIGGTKGSNSTINAPNTPEGVKTSNANKEAGNAPQYGRVIMVPSKDKGYADGGEVAPDAEQDSFKPEKEGAKALFGIDQPTGMLPEPTGAPSVSTNAPDLGANLPNLTDPVSVNTGVAQPKDRFAYLKSLDPSRSDKLILDQINTEQVMTKGHADERAQDEANQKGDALKQAQQKQQMGIPLSADEQAAIDTANQPTAADSMTSQQAPADQQTMPEPEAPPVKKDPYLDTMGMMKRGYEGQKAGIQAEATAAGQQGQHEAAVLEKNIQDQQVAQDMFKDRYDKLEMERQNHMHDIQAGYINPDKYWTGYTLPNGEKVGGHSKVASAIGIMLAGFNPSGRPNAALDMLEHQRNASIEAQKQNLASDHNLLAANLKQFGNLRDATEMTRVMMNDSLVQKMQQQAALSKDPLAQARAQQAIGVLRMDSAQKFRSVAMSQALMQMASNPNGTQSDGAVQQMLGMARATNPELAKSIESRYVPGMGLSSVPVPQAVREQLSSKHNLAQAGQDLLQYSRTHTNIVPGTAEYNFGVSKSLAFQQMVREGLLGTVFRESEKPLLEKFVNDNPAGAFKSITTDPKIRSVLESNAISLNTLKRDYGLPVHAPRQAAPQSSNSQQAAQQWLQANPNDPRAAKIRQALGGK